MSSLIRTGSGPLLHSAAPADVMATPGKSWPCAAKLTTGRPFLDIPIARQMATNPSNTNHLIALGSVFY